MVHVRSKAGVLLALLLVAAAPQSKDGKPTWNDWNAWNHFPEGAWVTIERDFRGESKTSYTDTLAKKTVDKLTVKTSRPEEEGRQACRRSAHRDHRRAPLRPK